MRHVVIPYAGSAGVVRHLVGAPGLVSFMGRKDRLAPTIVRLMGWVPRDKISHITINDPGHWGTVWEHLMSPALAQDVIEVVRGWGDEDRTDLWERLAGVPSSETPMGVAQFLYLQARSIRGLPLYHLGGADGRWVTHRANGTIKAAAQRQPPARDGSGGGLTSAGLLRRLVAFAGVRWPETRVTRLLASDLDVEDPGFAYLDPPYEGYTPYEFTETRAGVVRLALALSGRGSAVGVSEAAVLPALVRRGWGGADMTQSGHGGREALTWHRPGSGQ